MSQPRVKQHFGIQIGDFLELDGHYIEILEEIAKGGLGVVYKGKVYGSTQLIAIKQFQYPKFYNQCSDTNDCEKYWEIEARNTQLQAQSPEPCMRYYGALKITNYTDPEYYIFLEYIDGKPLNQWYRDRYNSLNDISLNELIMLREIGMQICRHLYYVHKSGNIVHRDLTIKNILITNVSTGLIPIIIDWGVSKQIPPEKIFNPHKPYFNRETEGGTAFMNRGSAPEIIGGYEPIAASDIYMFGHVLNYMFTGGQRLRTPTVPEEYVLHPRDYNPLIPEELDYIISQMTQYEPAERIKDTYIVWCALKKVHDDLIAYLQSGTPIPSTISLDSSIPSHPSSTIKVPITSLKASEKPVKNQISSEAMQFIADIDKIGEDLFKFLDTFEKYAHDWKNSPVHQINKLITNYQKRLINMAENFDTLWKLKTSQQIYDNHFVYMQKQELNKFSLDFQKLKDEFPEIQFQINEYASHATDESSEFINDIEKAVKDLVPLMNKSEYLSNPIKNQIQQQILDLTQELERLLEVRNYKQLLSGIYLTMKKQEYKRLNARLNDLKQQINHAMSASPNSHIDSSYLGKNVIVDYGHFLTLFLQRNLTFFCSHCKSPIPFGERVCNECDAHVKWEYDRQLITRKIYAKSKKGELYCPNPKCGAIIQLGWENCAYCGLSIKDMLNAIPKL